MKRWLLAVAALAALLPLDDPLSAVVPLSAAERIAAIVNKQVILSSDVDERTMEAAARMQVDPSDSVSMGKLRSDVLGQMVEKEVLLAEAQRQTIVVAPADVNQAVSREIDNLKQRLGPDEYQRAMTRERMTEADLRKKYEPDIRDQLMISRLVSKEVQSKVTATDAEVHAYWEANRDSIGKKPETLTLAHILIAFEPDSVQLKRCKARADSLRNLIIKGRPFDEVARNFSDDPSAKVGGDLGTFARGVMVSEFEDVAFNLKPMEISKPVRTRFGYHVIQVLQHFAATDSTEEQIHARHVMVQAKPTPADEERARKKATAVRDTLMRGTDFSDMARRYSADTATRDSGGVLGEIAIPSLPANLREPLSGLSVGEISVPFKREAGYHIFKVLERTPEVDYKYDDIKDDLKQVVMNKKMEEAYKRWYDKVRKTVNVEMKE
jgi:peptidyl-prolyl cis-trans isomerase SurA